MLLRGCSIKRGSSLTTCIDAQSCAAVVGLKVGKEERNDSAALAGRPNQDGHGVTVIF